jgi:chemotaxis protein methyltransferase CheR
MDTSTFRRFCSIAYEKAGISLGASKEALVIARVGKRLRALGIEHEEDYLALLEGDDDGEEMTQFLDVISTNHTAFFRESEHFDLLRKLAEDWLVEGVTKLRIWSAASSTGEEPYSIAFTLYDVLESAPVDWKILATDISTHVLKKAKEAAFRVEKLTGFEKRQRLRFFQGNDKSEEFVVKQDLRERVFFRWLNLSKPPYPMRGPFDVIFCRNVMIYFDQAVRQRVLSTMESLLRPGGYLMIGHAESLAGVKLGLQMVRPSIFVKREERP